MQERMCGKENTPPLLVRVQICTTKLEIHMVVSQKLGNQYTSELSNTTIVIIFKGCTNHKESCISMFIGTLFLITRTWKQSRCPSMEERIKKMCYIYAM